MRAKIQVGREDDPSLLREAGGGIMFQAHIFPFGKIIAYGIQTWQSSQPVILSEAKDPLF